MKIKGVIRMSVALGISDTTLYSILKKHNDFPVERTPDEGLVFDTDHVKVWWNQHYGVTERLKEGTAFSASKIARSVGVRGSLVTRWIIEGMPHERARSNTLAIDPEAAARWLIESGGIKRKYGERLLNRETPSEKTAESGR